MYEDVVVVINWLFGEVSTLAGVVWAAGWVGVCVLAIPLAQKVVKIFKSIF